MRTEAATELASSAQRSRVREVRVLVVDDEADVRESVADFVAAHFGVAVDVAGDAEQARRMLEERHYTLVVTDHRMPGGSGAELAAWVRATRPLTEVVMMTAYEVPMWALAPGVPVIAKPFRTQELQRVLAERIPARS